MVGKGWPWFLAQIVSSGESFDLLHLKPLKAPFSFIDSVFLVINN